APPRPRPSTLFPYTTLFRSRPGAHAQMIVGARDDEEVGLHVLVEDHLPRLGALDPEIFRHLTLEQRLDLGPYDVGNPVHGGSLRSEEHTSELQSREKLVCRL